MSFFTLLILSIGLSVDSFAASLGCGFSRQNVHRKRIFLLAFSLAIFQAIMPVIGWAAGSQVKNLIEQFDHWIALVLLTAIGAKMIIESIKKKNKPESCACDLSFREIITLSIGTSIDALIVGFSFAFLKINIIYASMIIGVTTFIFALAGIFIGKRAGRLLGEKTEIIGGIVLILIGLKIFLEHQFGINFF